MKSHSRMASHLMVICFLFLVAFSPGCWKPGAQKQTESLAEQVRNEPGCAAKLRHWFASTESQPNSNRSVGIPLPESLTSAWWRGAKAYPVWSSNGALLRINVTHDLYEPCVIIGSVSATPENLGLTREVGGPPTFYAQITNGIYTLGPLYK